MPQSSPSDRTAAAGRVAHLLAHDLVQPVAPFVTGFVTRLLGGTQPLGVILWVRPARARPGRYPGFLCDCRTSGRLDCWHAVT